MRLHPLHILPIASVAFACHTTVPDAAPTAKPGAPIVGDAFEVDVVLLPKPTPPSLNGAACIDYSEAERYDRELDAWVEAFEQREAAARGWRRLTEFVVLQYEELLDGTIKLYPRGEVEVVKRKPDRFIDQHGNTWLAVEGSKRTSRDGARTIHAGADDLPHVRTGKRIRLPAVSPLTVQFLRRTNVTGLLGGSKKLSAMTN